MCGPFYLRALDISSHTMVAIRRRVLDNDVMLPVHGNATKSLMGVKKSMLCAYLVRYYIFARSVTVCTQSCYVLQEVRLGASHTNLACHFTCAGYSTNMGTSAL